MEKVPHRLSTGYPQLFPKCLIVRKPDLFHFTTKGNPECQTLVGNGNQLAVGKIYSSVASALSTTPLTGYRRCRYYKDLHPSQLNEHPNSLNSSSLEILNLIILRFNRKEYKTKLRASTVAEPNLRRGEVYFIQSLTSEA